MTLALISMGIATLIGLLTWLPAFWRLRRMVACVAIICLSVSTGMVFGLHPSPWSTILLVLGVYQLINLLRVVEGRTTAKQLYKVSLRTCLWLASAQIIILFLALINTLADVNAIVWWYIVATAQIIATVSIYQFTRRNLRTTAPPTIKDNYADRDLPTLTVAIPARNETADLEACLKTLIHSDYPKLEILVLDDCSQNKRTPEIIRGFAHEGVRFMSGEMPPKNWVAKNFAYQQLADAANGEILLFCGVDTRFENGSLREMVGLLIQKNKQMLSVLPANTAPARWRMEDIMVQPARYAWELGLPRRRFNRPPVLSTCWLIRAETFKRAGTFKAITHSNAPERYFARYAVANNDSYSFVASNKTMGLHSAKNFFEQRATAFRTRYPLVHKRPELTVLLSISEFAVLVLPFIAFFVALAHAEWLLAAIFGISSIVLMGFYGLIVGLTYRKFLWRGTWLLPFAALYDIALLNYSMWQYEFREVIWKGRNICVPVMETIPALPKLK